jgi:hypothetical protein
VESRLLRKWLPPHDKPIEVCGEPIGELGALTGAGRYCSTVTSATTLDPELNDNEAVSDLVSGSFGQ